MTTPPATPLNRILELVEAARYALNEAAHAAELNRWADAADWASEAQEAVGDLCQLGTSIAVAPVDTWAEVPLVLGEGRLGGGPVVPPSVGPGGLPRANTDTGYADEPLF